MLVLNKKADGCVAYGALAYAFQMYYLCPPYVFALNKWVLVRFADGELAHRARFARAVYKSRYSAPENKKRRTRWFVYFCLVRCNGLEPLTFSTSRRHSTS